MSEGWVKMEKYHYWIWSQSERTAWITPLGDREHGDLWKWKRWAVKERNRKMTKCESLIIMMSLLKGFIKKKTEIPVWDACIYTTHTHMLLLSLTFCSFVSLEFTPIISCSREQENNLQVSFSSAAASSSSFIFLCLCFKQRRINNLFMAMYE